MARGVSLLIVLVTKIESVVYSEEKWTGFVPCKGYDNHQHPTTAIHAMYLSAFARKDTFTWDTHPLHSFPFLPLHNVLPWTERAPNSVLHQ